MSITMLFMKDIVFIPFRTNLISLLLGLKYISFVSFWAPNIRFVKRHPYGLKINKEIKNKHPSF
jgi:hypothetical protein